jgi:hypothetical protein
MRCLRHSSMVQFCSRLSTFLIARATSHGMPSLSGPSSLSYNVVVQIIRQLVVGEQVLVQLHSCTIGVPRPCFFSMSNKILRVHLKSPQDPFRKISYSRIAYTYCGLTMYLHNVYRTGTSMLMNTSMSTGVHIYIYIYIAIYYYYSSIYVTFVVNTFEDRHRVQHSLTTPWVPGTHGLTLIPTMTEVTSCSKTRGMIFFRVFFIFTTPENHVEYIPQSRQIADFMAHFDPMVRSCSCHFQR